MIIDLPPTTAQIVIEQAKQQGMTAQEWLINKIQSDYTPKDMLVTDFLKTLPNRTHLGDELALQKAVRDEWD